MYSPFGPWTLTPPVFPLEHSEAARAMQSFEFRPLKEGINVLRFEPVWLPTARVFDWLWMGADWVLTPPVVGR